MSINTLTNEFLSKTECLTTVFSSAKEYNVALNRYLRYSTNKDFITLYIHNPEGLVEFIKSNYLSKIKFDSIISIIYEKNDSEYTTKQRNQEFLRLLACEFDSTVIEYRTFNINSSTSDTMSATSDLILVIKSLNDVMITKNRHSSTPPYKFSINEIINISRDLIIDEMLK